MCSTDNLDYSKLGQAGFNCFKSLFLNVNAQNRFLDLSDNDFTVLQLQKLQGFDCLWHVAILSTDDKVRKQSRDFLIDLFLKFKVPEKERKILTDIFL